MGFLCFGVINMRWGHAAHLLLLPSGSEDMHVEVYTTGLQAEPEMV